MSPASIESSVGEILSRLELPERRFAATSPAEHFYANALRLDEMFEDVVLPLRGSLETACPDFSAPVPSIGSVRRAGGSANGRCRGSGQRDARHGANGPAIAILHEHHEAAGLRDAPEGGAAREGAHAGAQDRERPRHGDML
jgi:hypothetical protein